MGEKHEHSKHRDRNARRDRRDLSALSGRTGGWDEYAKACDQMFAALESSRQDRKRVHLQRTSDLLRHISEKALMTEGVMLPKRKLGRDQAADLSAKYVWEVF